MMPLSLIQSNYADWANPVTWASHESFLDLHAFGTREPSLHIYWQDVAVTWFLWRSDIPATAVVAPPWDDITLWYRAIDPLWVDPVLGDPLSEHIVSFINV